MLRVLITGCSRHSKSLIDALKDNKNNEEIFVVGVDCSENNLLKKNVDVTHIVPKITDSKYIDILVALCIRYKIDVLISYITGELELLSLNKEKFEENGTKVSCCDYETLKVVNNKTALYEKYSRFMPRQISVVNDKEKAIKFIDELNKDGKDVCIKIENGCGGKGFALINDEKSLRPELLNCAGKHRFISKEHLMKIIDKYKYNVILQEYIAGIDFSSVAISDKGNLVDIVGIEGYSMDYGAITHGKIVENKDAFKIHKEIIEETILDGNSCADFIIDNNKKVWLLEINPRISASLPFVCKAGKNMLYDRCQMLLGKPYTSTNNVKNGLEMKTYYERYYI